MGAMGIVFEALVEVMVGVTVGVMVEAVMVVSGWGANTGRATVVGLR